MPQPLIFICIALGIAVGVILSAQPQQWLSPATAQPTTAQQLTRLQPEEVAAQIYQEYPELPLENQYVRSRGNKVATDSTLISRFIQYHTLIKGRSPLYRLDWKISLADYLGLNEYLVENVYPGKSFLTQNPMARDRKLIRAFNLAQRTALVQALSDLYNDRPIASIKRPTSPQETESEPNAVELPSVTPLPSSQDAAEFLR